MSVGRERPKVFTWISRKAIATAIAGLLALTVAPARAAMEPTADPAIAITFQGFTADRMTSGEGAAAFAPNSPDPQNDGVYNLDVAFSGSHLLTSISVSAGSSVWNTVPGDGYHALGVTGLGASDPFLNLDTTDPNAPVETTINAGFTGKASYLLYLADNGTQAAGATYDVRVCFDDTDPSLCVTTTVTTPPLAPVNTAPIATDDVATTAEDTAVPVTLAGTDADNDYLTYTVTSLPSSGTLTAGVPEAPVVAGSPLAGNSVTYTPTSNSFGSDSFTFKVNDGALDSVSNATVSLTITSVADPTTLTDVAATVGTYARKTPVTFRSTVGSSDPDCAPGRVVTFTVTKEGTKPRTVTVTGTSDADTGVASAQALLTAGSYTVSATTPETTTPSCLAQSTTTPTAFTVSKPPRV